MSWRQSQALLEFFEPLSLIVAHHHCRCRTALQNLECLVHVMGKTLVLCDGLLELGDLFTLAGQSLPKFHAEGLLGTYRRAEFRLQILQLSDLSLHSLDLVPSPCGEVDDALQLFILYMAEPAE